MCDRYVFVQVNKDFVGPIILGWDMLGRFVVPKSFYLCIEGLSTTLNATCMEGYLHGNGICRGAPPILHLLFADDCLLFCNASVKECTRLKQILAYYERVSGQAINYEKLGVYFSWNVPEDRRDELRNILGIFNPLNMVQYLAYRL